VGASTRARLPKEHLGHVGEDVPLAYAVEHGQHARRGAATARADLEHHDRPITHTQLVERRAHRRHDAAVVKAAASRVLVHGKDGVHRAAREEQLLGRHLAGEHVREARTAPLGKLHLRPQIGMRGKHVGGRHAAVIAAAARGGAALRRAPRMEALVVRRGHCRLRWNNTHRVFNVAQRERLKHRVCARERSDVERRLCARHVAIERSARAVERATCRPRARGVRRDEARNVQRRLADAACRGDERRLSLFRRPALQPAHAAAR